MAGGLLEKLAGDRVRVRTAGSAPADEINPVAVEAMAEVGVDLGAELPKLLTTDAVREADAVITMAVATPARSFPASATRTGIWKIRRARTSSLSGRFATRSSAAYGRWWRSWLPAGERPTVAGDLLLGPRVRLLQVLMYEGDRHAALADGGGNTLYGGEPDVAAGEDARGAGLEQVRIAVELPAPGGGHVGAREHVAVAIERHLGRQPGGLCVRADEDEQPT